MGTITTISRCVVKDGKAFEGKMREILSQICNWKFNGRQLEAQFKGYKPTKYHSYSDEYTQDEMEKDAVQFLFNQLPIFGYRIYRNIGF